MALAFRTAITNNGATGTSVVVTLTGFSIGDLMLVAIAAQNGGASCTPPTGWTEIHDHVDSASNAVLGAFYYRIKDGTDGTTATFTLGGSTGWAFAATAAYDTAPLIVSAATVKASVDVSPQPQIAFSAIPAPGATGYLGVAYSAPRGQTITTHQVSVVPTGWTQVAAREPVSTSPFLHPTIFVKPNISSSGETPTGGLFSSGSYQTNAVIGLLAVTASSPPVADFTGTPTTGTSPLSVTFTDASTNTPTSWAWNFGDGGTSTSQNPTHSYAAPGTYTVVLVATNSAGANTKTRTAYIGVSGRVTATRAVDYTIESRVSATRLIEYALGTSRVTNTRQLVYAVNARVVATRALTYQVLIAPFRISSTRTLRWTLIGRPASTRTLDYQIAPGLEPAGRFCLAFDQGALQWDEAVWTRIDSTPNLVTSYQIDRGRQYELDRTDTGRATVVITDKNGILDPTNAHGPYFGRIQPLIQARLGRQNPVTGQWRTRYRGYVEDLTYAFDPSQKVNVLTVTLVDQFEILAAIEMQPGRFGVGITTDGQIKFGGAGVHDRITHCLDDAGIEPHARVVFSGNVDVQPVTYSAGESPMTVIQECADAEFPGVSNVYCDRQGRLCFHGRFAKFSPDEVAAGASIGAWNFQRWKIGDGRAVNASPADTAQLRTFGFERTVSKVINQASATPVNIKDKDVIGQLVEVPDGITRYGIRSWSAPNLVTADSAIDESDMLVETRRFSIYYAQNYCVPRDRIQGVSFRSMLPTDPRAAAVWKLLCELDIADAAAVTVASPGGGGFVADPYFVEGVHETSQPATGGYDDVTLTLDLSPAAYYTTNPWPGKCIAGRQLRYEVA